MAINVTNNFVNSQMSSIQKFHNIYKKNIDEKVPTPKNNALGNKDAFMLSNAGNSNNDMREYLTLDEKKVLKEVFGDFELDKNSATPYSGTRNIDFLKGIQIDMRL